jgi:hypothetical protein
LQRDHMAGLWVCGRQDVVPDAGPVYCLARWHGRSLAEQTS